MEPYSSDEVAQLSSSGGVLASFVAGLFKSAMPPGREPLPNQRVFDRQGVEYFERPNDDVRLRPL